MYNVVLQDIENLSNTFPWWREFQASLVPMSLVYIWWSGLLSTKSFYTTDM